MCGLLLRSIYGFEGRGMNFVQLTGQVIDKLGVTCGLWTPCVSVHREKDQRSALRPL